MPMLDFQDSFKALIEENKEMKLNDFFSMAQDHYEDEDRDFIIWFKDLFKNKNTHKCDPSWVIPQLEQNYPLFLEGLKYNRRFHEEESE